jgi:hypothetical protein
MVPAPAAVLSLLTRKLRDQERHSPLDDCHCDAALGWFAGWNVLPKKSLATDYSDRTTRENQRPRLRRGVPARGGLLVPQADTVALDFPPLPDRGDPTGLDRHYRPRRGSAGPSVQTVLAREPESRCRCSAHANWTRADQPTEVLRCVEFGQAVTGQDPRWLDIDSKVVDYPELSGIHARGIPFITIRRRGAALRRRWEALPRSGGTGAVWDTAPRCQPPIRYGDETIPLRHDPGSIRPIAVEGRGRPKPTRFRANPFQETPRNLIIRSAGRNRVEDGLGLSVNCFHRDGLTSAVRLPGDLDAVLTVRANGGSRGLGQRRRGYQTAAPKPWDRRFVEPGGIVKAQGEEIVVRFDRRSPNPILREAALDHEAQPIPGLGGRRIRFDLA